eukprot:402555-Alexandrium_andersonii.AAC.1
MLERIVLPGLAKIKEDAVALRRACRPGESLHLLVVDFADALHVFGVRPAERPFLVAKHPKG